MRHDVGNALHAGDLAPVLCAHLQLRVFGVQVNRVIVAAEALYQWAYKRQASQRNLQILRSIFLDFNLEKCIEIFNNGFAKFRWLGINTCRRHFENFDASNRKQYSKDHI